MVKSVKPSEINGRVKAPASKSMLQRAIAVSLLSGTPTRLTNTTFCSDSEAAIDIIRSLGANVKVEADSLLIKGGINPSGEELNCRESGLSIRMFTPIAALSHQKLVLTGSGSLLSRPVSMIESPLQQLGVFVSSSHGFPPITVQGPLKGRTANVDGSISSQFLTGLLIALPNAYGNSTLIVNELKSTPYIDLTLSLLKHFGVSIHHDRYRQFHIQGNQVPNAKNGEYNIEGDWSGAAFLLVAGAIAGSVTVTDLDPHSLQADARILDALREAGAHVRIDPLSPDTVQVECKELHSFSFDATHCPDLFPPLAVLAFHCKGKTVLHGVERLVHKESNRAAALQELFSSLGAALHINGNRMEIEGTPLNGGTVDSHNDHRIAMAAAVAALRARSNVTILRYECVNKSYPRFFDDFRQIGGITYE